MRRRGQAEDARNAGAFSASRLPMRQAAASIGSVQHLDRVSAGLNRVDLTVGIDDEGHTASNCGLWDKDPVFLGDMPVHKVTE